jgi:hypothetical protein
MRRPFCEGTRSSAAGKTRHLDRKLERMLAMLFKLQELRRAVSPT